MTEQEQPVYVEAGFSGVLSAALGCLLAGAGAGVAVGVVAAIVTHDWILSACAAGAVFGVGGGLMIFWTFARDPIRNAWDWERLAAECDAKDDLISDLEEWGKHLLGRLESAQRPIVVSEHGKTYTIPRQPRDVSWQNAVKLVRMTDDYGVIPGRGQTLLGQDEQAAALLVLINAELVAKKGTIFRLLVAAARAVEVLDVQGDPDESRSII